MNPRNTVRIRTATPGTQIHFWIISFDPYPSPHRVPPADRCPQPLRQADRVPCARQTDHSRRRVSYRPEALVSKFVLSAGEKCRRERPARTGNLLTPAPGPGETTPAKHPTPAAGLLIRGQPVHVRLRRAGPNPRPKAHRRKAATHPDGQSSQPHLPGSLR